jgi:hypothetical protein
MTFNDFPAEIKMADPNNNNAIEPAESWLFTTMVVFF